MQIERNKEYLFDDFAYMVRDRYSRDYLVNQMMLMLIPVIWRKEALFVNGKFIDELLSGKISL